MKQMPKISFYNNDNLEQSGFQKLLQNEKILARCEVLIKRISADEAGFGHFSYKLYSNQTAKF